MAAALQKGYSQVYERNEYAHDLDKGIRRGVGLWTKNGEP
jgi:hypothetical protein